MMTLASVNPNLNNMESELSIPTQLTNISNGTPTPKSKCSPRKLNENLENNSHHHEIYFTTQKKKRNKRNYNKINNEIDINDNLSNNIPKFKENYLDLLINSYDKLASERFINLNYLNLNNNYPKFTDDYFENSINENYFSKKCENKMCAIITDNPKNIFHAKFTLNFSYKSMSLLVCNKCYNAFKNKNYCYYCNTIYRDFDFNTQYYDTKKWILCDFCKRWQHMQCEEKKGKYKNIEELALNNNFKYMCPFCRNEDKLLEKQIKKSDRNKFLNVKTKRTLDLRNIHLET